MPTALSATIPLGVYFIIPASELLQFKVFFFHVPFYFGGKAEAGTHLYTLDAALFLFRQLPLPPHEKQGNNYCIWNATIAIFVV